MLDFNSEYDIIIDGINNDYKEKLEDLKFEIIENYYLQNGREPDEETLEEILRDYQEVEQFNNDPYKYNGVSIFDF